MTGSQRARVVSAIYGLLHIHGELRDLAFAQFLDEHGESTVHQWDDLDETTPDARTTWDEDCQASPHMVYQTRLTDAEQVEFWEEFDIHGNVRRKADWTGEVSCV